MAPKQRRGPRGDAVFVDDSDDATAGRAKRKTDTTTSNYYMLLLLGCLLLLSLAFVVVQSFGTTAGEEDGSRQGGGAAAATQAFFGGGLLQSFSKAHNASLLWGTYRPGVYFGIRSRTFPTALVGGLMWASSAGGGANKLRHKCEQDEVERYGFSMHDGRTFGVQPIVDRGNGLALETSFVRGSDAESWAARIEGSPMEGVAPREQTLTFYLASDAEFSTSPRAGSLDKGPTLAFQRGGADAHVSGHVDAIGAFSVFASAQEGGSAAARAKVRMWGTSDAGKSHLNVEDLVAQNARGQPQQPQQPPQPRRKTMPESVAKGSHLVTLQVVVTPPFVLDVAFVPLECVDDAHADACEAAHGRLTGDGLTQTLAAKRTAFEQRLHDDFLGGGGLRLRGAPLGADARAFASHSLSALLGSMGFFYGSSAVASSPAAAAGRTPLAPLLAVVPSRPFFPRGFLWDEGFHQLVVSAWDPSLSDDILANWMGLMHADGWIPREQILGAEAVARVPSEFLSQHREHANPPALLLRIQRLLDASAPAAGGASSSSSAQGAAAAALRDGAHDWLPLLRTLWPWLVQWHAWFVRTQAGSKPHSFRWRGRDEGDNRLNAMTLSSGLDDYPRATKPSHTERHVDLHSWVAFFTRMLAQLGERLGKADEAATYRKQLDALMASLVTLHWDDKVGAFCDHGRHANAGSFVEWYVVKCATNDGASQVEHAIPNPNRPTCPKSHPRYLFPLGDGRGGLLTREKMVPKGEREQFVEHLGYVSLFPLLLKLLPADAPQLLPLIELVRDPEKLWSDYGVRSLSKADIWHGRQNAPGDDPYWRGPIWINLNYLLLGGLKHYASAAGPAQARAAEVYAELRDNLVGNMLDEWKRTGYLWEQYDPETGQGKRTHPFNGWSSLVVLALAEIY